MKHALALTVIFGVFVLLARREVFPWPYSYDEADYMFAASLGARANWTDRPSQPLADFVRIGLRDGADPSKRARLSAMARTGSDVNFYRHWHGPLYFYWLAALAPLRLDEGATRSLSYLFPILTTLAMYFGILWIFSDPAAAMLSAALFLWSYPTVFSNEIAPHQLFVLCAIVALVLLMKWRETRQVRYWYGSVIVAAWGFCTLEVAFVLVAVLILCADRIPSIGKSALALVLAVAAVWPAAIAKLTFVKAYLFMAYLAVFRRSAWGQTGFFETWRLRFLESPFEWLLCAAAVVLYFRACDGRTRRSLAPVVLFGCLMLAALLRVNSDTPRYQLPFLPAFQFAAGCVIASVMKRWTPRARRAVVAAILILLFTGTLTQIRTHPVLSAPRLAQVLAAVRAASLDGKALLAPQNDVPMIHYYFPRIDLSGYAGEQQGSSALARSDLDAVLKPGYPADLWRRSIDSSHYSSQR